MCLRVVEGGRELASGRLWVGRPVTLAVVQESTIKAVGFTSWNPHDPQAVQE